MIIFNPFKSVKRENETKSSKTGNFGKDVDVGELKTISFKRRKAISLLKNYHINAAVLDTDHDRISWLSAFWRKRRLSDDDCDFVIRTLGDLERSITHHLDGTYTEGMHSKTHGDLIGFVYSDMSPFEYRDLLKEKEGDIFGVKEQFSHYDEIGRAVWIDKLIKKGDDDYYLVQEIMNINEHLDENNGAL